MTKINTAEGESNCFCVCLLKQGSPNTIEKVGKSGGGRPTRKDPCDRAPQVGAFDRVVLDPVGKKEYVKVIQIENHKHVAKGRETKCIILSQSELPLKNETSNTKECSL